MKKYILIFIITIVNFSYAQVTNINVSVNIVAPYSPYIADYIGTQTKTVVTLIPNGASTDMASVYFKASIVGDNGVSVYTKAGYKPPTAYQINGGFAKILTGKILADYFDVGNMIFTGVTLQQLQFGNGLPEGSYTICIQVFDYNTDLPLSQMSPMGCSAPITIQHVDPPLPLSPQCATVLTPTPVQNILINWSYNPGVTPNVQYLLKIVPVLPTQNANDAINTMVTPAFFEKITKGTSYLYGPADPKLVLGQKYAYRLKAYDPNGKILFKNNGESEVCTFTYGEKDTSGIVEIQRGGGNITLQGKLEYYFRNTSMQKQMVAGEKGKPPYMKEKLITTKKSHPLAKEKIEVIIVTALVQAFPIKRYDKKTNKYITYDSIPTINETPFFGWTPDAKSPLNGKVLGNAYTDEAGNFTLNFSREDNPLLTEAEIGGKNEMIGNEGQKIVAIRGLLIKVANPYYGDATSVIFIEKGGKKSNIDLNVPVQQYTLKLKLENHENAKEYYTGKTTPLSGNYKKNVDVYILRIHGVRIPGKVSYAAPNYECESTTGKPIEEFYLTKEECAAKQYPSTKYLVVYKKSVPMNSTIEIKDMVQNIKAGSDDYYIMARVPGTNIYYSPQKLSFKDISNDGNKDEPNIMLYALSVDVPKHQVDYKVFQSNLAIQGNIKYSFTDNYGTPNTAIAKPLAGVKLNLVGSYVIKPKNSTKSYEYSNGNIYATTTSNSDGDFSFDNIGYVGLSSLGGQNLSWNKNQTRDVIDENGNKKTITGDINYVLRVEVQSPYYYSPDNDFLVEPGYSYNVGSVYASVKECNPTIDKLLAYNASIHNMSDIKSLPAKGGEKVYLLLRKDKVPNNFPVFNRNLSKDVIEIDNKKYTVIDEDISTNDGKFSFTHVALNDKNNKDEYYLYSESPKTSLDNYMTLFVSNIKIVDNSNSSYYANYTEHNKKYNSQQKILKPSFSTKIVTFANAPLINGAVYPESNMANNPIEGVVIKLYDISEGFDIKSSDNLSWKFIWNQSKFKLEKEITTSDNGKFEFKCNSSNGFTGRKLLYFYKPGFDIKIILVNEGKKLIMGQRAPLNKVALELPLTVKAKVKNSNGELVDAKIIVGKNFSWAKTTNLYHPKTYVIVDQNLELLVPSMTVSIKVFPSDNNTYMPSEQEFTFTKSGPKFIELLAKPREHSFDVVGYYKKDNEKVIIPVTVEVNSINPKQKFEPSSVMNIATGKSSFATALNFVSSTNSFDVVLKSEGFAPIKTKFYNVTGKNETHTIQFEKAVSVNGTVTLNNAPLANAKIFIKDKSEIVEVLTNAQGKFTLNGLSQNSTNEVLAVVAPKGINAVGVSKQFNPSINKTLNINLEEFKAFDLTNIQGFEMEVYGLKINLGNPESYNIDCRIKTSGKDNAVFSANDDNYIEFANMKVKAGNTPSGKSLPEALLFNESAISSSQLLPIKSYKTYVGNLERLKGIEFKTEKNNKASVCGFVSINEESFKKGFDIQELGSKIYLSTKNFKSKSNEVEKTEKLPVFTSLSNSNFDYFSDGFMISNRNFENVNVKLHNRYSASKLKAEKSIFNQDGIKAETILTTNIPQFSDPNIKLNIGLLEVNANGPKGISESKSITIPLGKWSFVTSKYTLSSEGLIVDGNIMAGLFAVPTKNLLIDYDQLLYGSYNVNQIKLGGYIPLNLTEQNSTVSFGFDKGYGDKGSWSLTILPKGTDVLTSLTGLPSLGNNDRIDLASVALFSTGDDALMISTQTPKVTLNGFAKYKPALASVYPGGLKFRGAIDLDIPKCPELSSYDLNYELKNGKLAHIHNIEFKDANYKPIVINTKGVVLSFSNQNQVFENGKLILKGKITDQDPNVKYSFDYTLTKTNNSTKIVLDEDKKQYYYLTGNNTQGLENIKGTMNVASNNVEWERFNFSGDMFGYDGISKTKRTLSFEVKGDLVANNSEIGVQNMNKDGIGAMSITYDFKEKALLGSLHIDRDFESYYLMADLEMKVGGNGWYLFGAGEMEVKDMELPVKRIKAAFFVGNSAMTSKQTALFATMFYKNELPETFPKGTIKGIVFGAAISFPIPKVPQINIPLKPIIHVVFEHQININGYFSINFADDPTLSVGLQAYVYVHLGAGMSVGLACAGADFKVTAGGKGFASISKSANFNLGVVAFLEVSGSAYVGVGGCDDDCGDLCWCLPGCYTTGWGKTIGMEFEISVSRNNGKSGFDIGFKNVKW